MHATRGSNVWYEDMGHSKPIMERYADLQIELADAPVVVLANRHKTLDLRVRTSFTSARSAAQAASRSDCSRSTLELVDQMRLSWNQLVLWLTRVEKLRSDVSDL